LAAAALRHVDDSIRMALGVLLAVTLGARAVRQIVERGSSVRITYPGARVVTVPIGFSILDASRQERIPHASVCGGRGRCSTCRVRILSGSGPLPAPGPTEARVLARLNATPDVRLACQLRPVNDLSIIPLIPPSVAPVESLSHPGLMAGREREVCVMFADLRGFTKIAEKRLPYDTVFLLNRYFETAKTRPQAAQVVFVLTQFPEIKQVTITVENMPNGARKTARATPSPQRARCIGRLPN